MPGNDDGFPQPTRLEDLGRDRRRALLDRLSTEDPEVARAVQGILAQVRTTGDDAVLGLTERFDGVRPARLLLGPPDFKAALASLDPALRKTLERAARNLKTVAAATRPQAARRVDVEPGLVVEETVVPLARVGAYVPGGKAAYPSSVLMEVVPAKVAGVREVVVASPPGADGKPPPVVLAACAIAGADACLVAGGAQAIAALAYGTKTVPAVDKIVGPGNRYVTAAKQQVYGRVDIDSPAGPTEVLILADDSADTEWVALDLVAQAEHADDSQCILVTPSTALAHAVAERVLALAEDAPRRDTILAAWRTKGAILVARDRKEATTFARAYAPEHLQVMTKDAATWADEVPTAATTFIGPYAPVPAGDYLTGANHVLPTMGAARWAAPLSVHSFLVRRTRQHIDAHAAAALAPDLATLARSEGLESHARSMAARAKGARA